MHCQPLRRARALPSAAMRVWIDLTNSPHVLVMRPLIALLRSDGSLRGPDVDIAGQAFAVGDQVICRAPTRLRPDGGQRGSEVRNGTRGVVTAVHDGPAPELSVDFEHRGPIRVPAELLAKRIRGRSVVGVLTHAYCLTTHAAQGDTYHAGRLLASDASSREGVYVGLTRGEHDARVYVVAHNDLDPRRPDDHLPRIGRDFDPVLATQRRLSSVPADTPAVEHVFDER